MLKIRRHHCQVNKSLVLLMLISKNENAVSKDLFSQARDIQEGPVSYGLSFFDFVVEMN